MASRAKSGTAMRKLAEQFYTKYEQMYRHASEDLEAGNYDLAPCLNEKHLLIQKEALLLDFLRDLTALTF